MLHNIWRGGGYWEVYETSFSINFLVSLLLGMWGQLAVIIFIIISAYYLVDKPKINCKRIISLILQTILLTFIIKCVSIPTKINNFSLIFLIKSIYQSIIAPFIGTYWFITTYLLFYMLSPIMHFCTSNLTKDSHKHVCVVLIIMVFGLSLIKKSYGGTLLEFCSLYFIVAYIKKYKEEIMRIECKKYFKYGLLTLILGCISLNIISTISGITVFSRQMPRLFVNWNPILVMTSLSLFYVFKNYIYINSQSVSNIICNISKTSMGVYILHENSVWGGTSSILWCKWLNLGKYFYNSTIFFIYFIGSVILVFIFCCTFEVIREKIFAKITVNKFKEKLNIIYNKFDNYYVCINK